MHADSKIAASAGTYRIRVTRRRFRTMDRMECCIFVVANSARKRVDRRRRHGNVLSGSTLSARISHIVFAALLGTFASTAGAHADMGDVTEWPLPQIPEPSGVAYHAGRNTLFVVGDQGDIGEVGLDGELLASRHIGGDLEGITCDPARDVLYVAREGVDVILEVRPSDLQVIHEVPIDRSFAGDPNFLQAGGDGVEGIAFVPPASGSGAGTLFVVNQFDPPVLVELEMGRRAAIRNAWKLSTAPLSDVVWDEKVGAFLVVSAIWRKAALISSTGEEWGSVAVPGFLQEGIALLRDGSFVIAQDSGGLLRWKPSTDPFAAAADRAGHGTNGAVSQGAQH
jgi:hypothetical protein